MTFERLLPLLALVAISVFHKRKKEHASRKKDYITGLQDYITRLPDDILCHIISYLRTKDVRKTSVLSKRWRKLYYTLLRNPEFDYDKMLSRTKRNNWGRDYKQRFVTTVDTFLRLRSDYPMESFTLRFGLMREFPGHSRRWLNCIVRSGVRKLDIDFCCNNKLRKIPDSRLTVFPFELLLTVRMLEYVQLSLCILEPNFRGPSNSLKELSLSLVPLVNGEVESILSYCPQLVLLELSYCKLPRKLLVSALELRTLKIKSCKQVNEIGFSAPNLELFYYYGNSALSFSLESSYVISIQIEMPILSNLHTLSLHIIKEALDLRDIISMIAVCPKLSRFELSAPLCLLSYTERAAEIPPTFVRLKSVSLDGFKFESAQKKFASQLIRCAPVLEIMRIYTKYCKYHFGKNVEKTLPKEKRGFSRELISRTKRQLEEQASSSLSIHFFS